MMDQCGFLDPTCSQVLDEIRTNRCFSRSSSIWVITGAYYPRPGMSTRQVMHPAAEMDITLNYSQPHFLSVHQQAKVGKP